MAKILGVLGGMGPLASAQFMLRLTLLTPAARDQEHIPAVLWSDPRVPDRTAAGWPAARTRCPGCCAASRGLEAAGCGAIAIPCNTAHGWYDAMQAATACRSCTSSMRRRRNCVRLGVPHGGSA